VARTPNYGFEKRRKEQERKDKKAEKAKRRAEEKGEGDMISDADLEALGLPPRPVAEDAPGGDTPA
jgi:hypothetical protein